MEPMDENAGGAPARWRDLAQIDEARGVWMVEEPAEGRQVWLIRLNAAQRADGELTAALGKVIGELATLAEPQLGVPVTGARELAESGEIGFAVPPGQLWGDVFPLGKKMPWASARSWALSFARVLETASRHGRVDGSLHPSRVWLTEDGRILVPGFGLGPLLDPARQGDVRQIWFSPQAVDGFPVTALDDRYSVGGMVYQAVTGVAPLDPNNRVYEIRYTTPASPLKAGAEIPPRTSETIMACLEKDPAKRPASSAVLIGGFDVVNVSAPQKGKPFMPVEFDPTLSQAQPLPPPPSFGPVRPLLLRPEVWFATFVMVAAAGLGAWMIWFSWPKEKAGPGAGGPKTQAETDRELEARLRREAAAQGASNGIVGDAVVTNLAELLAFTPTNPPAAPVVAVPEKTVDPSLETLRKDSERRAEEIIEQAKRRAEEQFKKDQEASEKKRQAAAAEEQSKFVPIFNGQDLNGWSGDTNYWSVQNGTLTGWIGADATPGTIGWLVSGQPAVGDFELRGQFRMRLLRDNRAGSAAVLYRATAAGRDGYHFALGFDPALIGSVVGNSGRGILAIQGQMAEQLQAAAARPISSALPGAAAAHAGIRMNDWNEFRILARGDTVTHELNGHTVAVLKDGSPLRPRTGAISLRVGGEMPACVVQFKELKLRRE